MIRIILIALLSGITVTVGLGQQADSTQHTNIFQRSGRDISQMGITVFETYKGPLRWKKKEWITFSAVIGGSVLVSTLDKPINDFFSDRQSDFMDGLSDVGYVMGKPNVIYPVMLSMWGVGAVSNNAWMRDTGIMMIASVTSSGIIQTVGKSLIGRARPNTGEGPYSFNPFGGPDYHSLPSGHTSLAFALHWVLARQINWLPGKILVYSIPVVVAVSRIYDGAHWFSDVFLGAALGIAGAESALALYPRLKNKETGLTMSSTQNGLGLVYKF